MEQTPQIKDSFPKAEILMLNNKEYTEQNVHDNIIQRKLNLITLLDKYKEILCDKYDEVAQKMKGQYKDILERFEGDGQNHDTNVNTYREIIIEENKSNIQKFIEVDSIIQKGLNYSFDNLKSYLDSIDLEKHDNYIGAFLSKTLLNERLLQDNYDYTSFSLDFENKQIGESINDTLMLKINGDNISYSINDDSSKEKDIKFINDNSNIIASLNIQEVKLKGQDYFNNTKTIYNKLKELSYKDCIIELTENKNELIKESERFPSLISLSFNNSFPPQNSQILYNTLPPFTITSSMPHLQVLRFDKGNIVNSEFNKIMTEVIFNTILNKTLKILSFSENCLTTIDFNQKIIIPKNALESLEELNLSNNRIYIFKLDYLSFPRLQLINLIDNHFSNLTDLDLPKKNCTTLVLTNRNFYLSSKINMTTYLDSLKTILPMSKYKFQYMTFSGLFNRFTNQGLLDLILSPVSYLTLINLDLSYCGLNTDIVIEFLLRNNKMIKLKTLNLKSNFISIDFFEKYNKQFDNSIGKKRFIYLEDLSLSNNNITNEDFKHVLEFIKSHKNFKHLNLQMNPFGKEYLADKMMSEDKKNPIVQKNDDMNLRQTFYSVERRLKDKLIENMDFCDLLREIYYSKHPLRKFYIDFSTDSRMLVASQIEKKQNVYMIKQRDKMK